METQAVLSSSCCWVEVLCLSREHVADDIVPNACDSAKRTRDSEASARDSRDQSSCVSNKIPSR